MKTRLSNNLEEDLKTTVEREFVGSFHLREQMIKVLTRDIESLQQVMRDDGAYDKPGWPYKQANLLGQVKAITKIISLLE